MKSTVYVIMIVLAVLAFLPEGVSAQDKPVNLSLFTPLQIFSADKSIGYFRFNLIYGRNTTLTSGLDLGLVNHLTAGESMGVQWGLVNWVDADMKGWQNGWINATKGNFTGFQWGFVNYSGHTKGLMLGFVNYTETMHGLQIGLINVIMEGSNIYKFFPIFNFTF